MLKLRVNELILFEEATGVAFTRAAKRMAPQFCQKHRLEAGACADCLAAKGLCSLHSSVWQTCEVCEGADIPMRWLAALGWLLRRRESPGLAYEEFMETANFDEVMAELGNA